MTTPTSPNTPLPPTTVIKRPYGRSLSDFGELRGAEKILLDCCARGAGAWIGNSVPINDSDHGKVIRADFLRFLLLGGDGQAPVHEKGVQLIGAWIVGELDLEDCFVPRGMRFLKCKFDGPITARYAHIAGLLALPGSHLLQGLHADQSRCDSGIYLQAGFRSLGEVRLIGGRIGGDLNCSTGNFESGSYFALIADGVVVQGNVLLNERFKATGEVRLIGAQISGNLECSDGNFEPRVGAGLLADYAVVNGSVLLKSHFKATGEVRLLNVQIGGNLECSGGQFEPKEGCAILADRIVVKGGVYMVGDFKAIGQVRLVGAQIGSNLACIAGKFEVAEGNAINASNMVVKGNVFFNAFKATGAVCLEGAQIDGHLDCQSSEFSGTAENGLNLQTAIIKNIFNLSGLANPVRIIATSAQVGVLVDERNAWATGSILDGLVYKSLGGATDVAARIDWLRKQSAKHLGENKLKTDFRRQPWKQLQKVFREMGHDADAREVGVAYENQLRKADRIGQITNVKNGNRCILSLRRAFLRGLHWFFGFLAGYGYHPLRLFMSLVGVWLFCGVTYWGLALSPNNAIGPTDPLVFQNDAYAACAQKENGTWMLCGQLPTEYTTFSPFAYSLDILLPLVDLGQEKRWGPLVPTPTREFFGELLSLSPPHWVRLLNWFQILYGWIASLLFVAIVSGMSRRSEME